MFKNALQKPMEHGSRTLLLENGLTADEERKRIGKRVARAMNAAAAAKLSNAPDADRKERIAREEAEEGDRFGFHSHRK